MTGTHEPERRRRLLPFPWLFTGRRTVRSLVARIQGLEHVVREGCVLDRRERGILTDALMVFMHEVERAPGNDDPGLMAACQVLLERLMGLPDDFPAPMPGARQLRVVRWQHPSGPS